MFWFFFFYLDSEKLEGMQTLAKEIQEHSYLDIRYKRYMDMK